jgi:hypothetical protein
LTPPVTTMYAVGMARTGRPTTTPPRTCLKCGKRFPNHVLIDGRVRQLYGRRYCLDCHPFGAPDRKPLHDPVAMSPNRVCSKCGRRYKYGGKYNSQGHRKEICNSCRAVLRAKRQKQRAVAYKGGVCQGQDCGYHKNSAALCFHHRDGDEKFDIISKMYSTSWEKLRAELDKCDLLCLNCHAELHAEEWGDRPYSRSRFGDADPE